MLRDAVRSLAEAKIAPYAAAVDEEARFPQEALDAWSPTTCTPCTSPRATARGRRRPRHGHRDRGGGPRLRVLLADPRGEQAGLAAGDPLRFRGAEEEVHDPARQGRRDVLVLPLRAGRRLRRGRHEDQGRPRRRPLRPQRRQALDHQRGRLRVLHRDGGHRPEKRSKGISAFVVEKSDEGVSFGAPEKKLGIKGSPTREVYLDNVRIPADRMIGAEGTGFATAMKTLDHTRITIAAQALGIAQRPRLRQGLCQGAQAVRQADRRLPGHPVHAGRHGMKIEAARQLTYAAAAKSERGDSDLTFQGAAAKCFASDVAMEVTTDAVQLLGGYGYTRDYPVERMMRDAKITQIYEGTNQVQRIVMARNLP